MKVVEWIKKIHNWVAARKNSDLKISKKKHLKILHSLPEPRDDLQRSYNQYKAQSRVSGRIYSFFVNIACWLPYCAMKKRMQNKQAVSYEAGVDAVFLSDGKPSNIIPDCLREEYVVILDEKDVAVEEYITEKDTHFFKAVQKRYPGSWQFQFKTLLKMARYRYLIDRYAPKALIVCNEYSFTSSILREFCQQNGVALINVMHGEKIFDITDSFFHFDRCYVWSDFYKDLFIRLRAEATQFRIATPQSLCIQRMSVPIVDYTYYFGDERQSDMKKVYALLSILKSKGHKIAVRPHPRYSDMRSVEAIFKDIEIENYKKTSIEQSLIRTKNVISLMSTVLNQAHHSNIPIIIDDITRAKIYKKLEEVDYIMLNVEHKKLSELLVE